MREKIIVKTLSDETLIGRTNCDIYFVNHRGSYSDLCGEALKRNIYLISISMKTYREFVKKGVSDGSTL